MRVMGFLCEGGMDSLTIRFIPWPLIPLLVFASLPLVSRSFDPRGGDLIRSECWLALLSFSALGGNLSVDRDFLCGL